jgi:outer membrane protein TolC
MVRLMEKRLAVGEAARPDVAQAQIALAQTRLALQNARILLSQARTRLAMAIGVPTDSLNNVAVFLNDFTLPPPEDLDAAGLRHRALTNRADILAALAEYDASQAALQLEVANQYPNLRLGPGYTWDAGAAKWSLGLSLPLPLLNRNEGPIAEAEARRKLAAANFAAMQARALGEVEQALAGYRSAAQALSAADTSLAEHKQVRRSVFAQFETAEIDRLGTVSTQVVVTLADVARSNAWVAAQQALGRLEDALQRPLDVPLPAVPETNQREENKP